MIKETAEDINYMLAIVDYGVGNLFSLESSVRAIGCETIVTSDPERIMSAERIILPGVGAFGDAVGKLRASGLDRTVTEAAAGGIPLLGICVGMQMLFDTDYEYGEHKGLGLIPGEVHSLREIVSPELKIPAIGWSGLSFKKRSRLFEGITEGEYVYFVHSYAATGCDGYISAVTDYGSTVTAAVENGNIYGTQFHPEKSSTSGLKILKNFCSL